MIAKSPQVLMDLCFIYSPVITALGQHVIKTENYLHSYPYDWRTKQPIIIRASKQWFIDLKRLKPLALVKKSFIYVWQVFLSLVRFQSLLD